MLHSFSRAAAEHSRTQDLSTGLSIRNFSGRDASGHTTSLLDAVDSENEEWSETTLFQRFGICIGYLIPDWGHLSLANVGRSWAAGAVALWHCYLFASCASLIVVNFAAAMLRSYIQWFSETSIHVDTFYTADFRYHVTLGFFGAFFRCYILLSVASDLLRFTYLLCKDTWRADSFEAYRRLVVGDAWQEIEAGEIYSNNWSICLSRQQKMADVFFQIFLHGSLDVLPVILCFHGLVGDDSAAVSGCRMCLFIGVFHILAFYFLWLFGEVYLKVHHFRTSWQVARGHAAVQTQRVGTHQRTLMYCVSLAEGRSLYVCFGQCMHGLGRSLPVCLALAAIILGVLVDRNIWAVCSGSVCAVMMLILAALNEKVESFAPKFSPKWAQRFFPHSQALQEWSERWCGLGLRSQKRQRYPFMMTLGLSALLFGFFRFPAVMMGCVGLSCCAFLRVICIFAEGNIGWLWAFVECMAELILLNFVVISTACNALTDATVVMTLSAMRQFGFQRRMSAGERLRMGCVNIMGVIHLLFLLLVCFAFETYGVDSKWSAFGPQLNATKFYAFQPDPAHPVETIHAPQVPLMPPRNIFPMCNFRFRRGFDTDYHRGISLADFGLMASLTYEPHDRVGEACRYYFHDKWHVEPQFHHRGAKYLMFTSGDNQTTVIAVRGTLDFLDVLQDVSLWIVPAMLQIFGLIGLDTSYGAWGMATAELSHLIPVANIDREATVQAVLSATSFMLKHYPGREFYITGHSLGGGLAKLVKLAVSTPGVTRLQVVTFSAPGVHHAAHVLMPKMGRHWHGNELQLQQDLHKKMKEESVSVVAVRPSNDLISLIDESRGQTLVSPCSGTAYECHSIYRTLWNIFSVCGSMRGTELKVPCGWSPQGPC